MNKTIIININGLIFHIEEDAYEVLKKYMTEVKRHFMDSADSLEITTDIENRIAEMFTEILQAEGKQVIIEQDVNNVVGQMGTIEDFASADDEGGPTTGHHAYKYQNINRRLFRDGEDHLLGGVCAGIANYFDIQPVWVRLAFAIAFFFFGTGLLLYIILWIVVPKAVTRTDRMAMKGEPLDLQGFKRSFEEEMKGAKGHAAALHMEARPFIYRTRDFAGDFIEHLRRFLVELGSILLKILGVIIMLICLGALIALLVCVFAFFAYDSPHIDTIFPFSIIDRDYILPFTIACFFLLAMPLLGLVLKTSRMVFNRAPLGRTTGYTLLLIWIISVCMVTYYTARVASAFRSGGKINQTVNIKANAGKVYYLKMNDIRYLSTQDSARLDIKHTFAGKIIMDDDWNYNINEMKRRNVTLAIEKSEGPQPVLVESFRARGSNYTNALINARNIVYRVTQTDSVLLFDRHTQLTDRDVWRNQRVALTLKIPVGTKVVIDNGLDVYLDNVDFYAGMQEKSADQRNVATFIMADDGLQCYTPGTTAIKKP